MNFELHHPQQLELTRSVHQHPIPNPQKKVKAGLEARASHGNAAGFGVQRLWVDTKSELTAGGKGILDGVKGELTAGDEESRVGKKAG